ncbi:hypothetical protein BDV96DRAFT_75187 [Lophiotrema nucula]|uniref:Uncharacterized protein n=1 Tax=Lophiotrema nucula TaxID=690887 RepID=A0A6A5Z824_9PLEO|nr:hypothetical protein BDV96DRAFT_75187 [Lophiotrema nucula]
MGKVPAKVAQCISGSDNLVYPCGDPSSPPDRPSLFLSLPRELRDEVYEFALTYNDNLIAEVAENRYGSDGNQPDHAWLRLRQPHTDQESNQLRYVCRQLHEETSGLSIKLNDILVVATPHQRSIQLFAYFLKYSCALKYQHTFRNLSFHENVVTPNVFPDHWLQNTLQHLGSVCTSNPSSTVTIHVDEFFGAHLSPEGWRLYGSIFQQVLHGTMPGDIPRSYQYMAFFWANKYLETRDSNGCLSRIIVPANLRIFPMVRPFEETFRNVLHASASGGSSSFKAADMRHIERWCREGF